MINLVTIEVENTPTIEEGIKMLRTKYRDNFPRYEEQWLKPLSRFLEVNNVYGRQGILKLYKDSFFKYAPYTYEEAFRINNAAFRAQVFSAINVVEMIENLGHTRIATSGVELQNYVWNQALKKFDTILFHQVYELHKVNGAQLGIEKPLFAVRCWCTSTNNEHWIWTNEDKDPLQAIASCCMVYESMLDKIAYIIRQGDVFLCGMKQFHIIPENDKIVSLNKEQYFKLLISQS